MLSVSLEISLNVRNQKNNRNLTMTDLKTAHSIETVVKFELKLKEGVSCGHVFHIAC